MRLAELSTLALLTILHKRPWRDSEKKFSKRIMAMRVLKFRLQPMRACGFAGPVGRRHAQMRLEAGVPRRMRRG